MKRGATASSPSRGCPRRRRNGARALRGRLRDRRERGHLTRGPVRVPSFRVHLHNISIKAIRSVESFEWRCPEPRAGWHVLLGDNGAGKSTILRSVALALNGPEEARALRQDWRRWLADGAEDGEIVVDVAGHDPWDRFAQTGRRLENYYARVALGLERDGGRVQPPSALNTGQKPHRHVWGGRGWFSASYGPFRRFSGGDKDAEKIFFSNPRLARHLSTFGENVALSETLSWLRDLKFKALEEEKEGVPNGGAPGRLLTRLFQFINESGLLPNDVRIKDVGSDAVVFLDANGIEVPVDDLSDGYRSILSLAFELIRQLVAEFGENRVFARDEPRVVVPGVVLIDEVDVHLHPRWQRRIGHWFVDRFPQMQFIVTTHSPLICQAAVHGSIYRLPQPGAGAKGEMLSGEERDRLLYGTVLDAYETESFGYLATRSEAGVEQMQRLAELNAKAKRAPLSPREEEERARLAAALPSARPGEPGS